MQMEEKGWTVVTKGKRSRSVKINRSNEKLNPKKRRKHEHNEEDETILNIIEPQPELELKVPPVKKKNQRNLHPQGISVRDLQNLIFWVFDKGINPNWIFLKNRTLLSKMVIVAIGNFNDQFYNEHIESLPSFKKIFTNNKKTTVIPGTEMKVYSPLQALLYLPENKKSKKKTDSRTPETCSLPLESYVHSLSLLAQHGFPLQIKSVTEGTDVQTNETETIVEYERKPGFVVFGELNQPSPDSQTMIAIDCEMCLTKAGSELTRVTLVDMNCDVIYDQLVKPKNPITDYLTQYSGITKELLDPVQTTLEDVQDHLRSIISKDTILVGHSLENDLIALKVSHFNVIDTSIWYPHSAGPPSKLSLKCLVQTYLNRIIQTGSHDSAQDAIAAMELAKLKIKYGPTFGVTKIGGVTVFDKLKQSGKHALMIDRSSLVSSHCQGTGITCNSDAELPACLRNTFESNTSPDFVYTQIHGLSNLSRNQSAENPNEGPTLKETLSEVDTLMNQVYESLPKSTLFVVTSGQANLSACSKLWKQKRNEGGTWNESQNLKLKQETEKARTGLSLFAIKS